jgi:hypothetical protein
MVSPTTVDRSSSYQIRASVLDAALELGLTNEGGVAEWLYNPIQEQDEVRVLSISPKF